MYLCGPPITHAEEAVWPAQARCIAVQRGVRGPLGLKPYAELIRAHRPAGIAMFFFPLFYGDIFAAILGICTDINSTCLTIGKLLILAFLLRGALCTWNDVLDQDIYRMVARTRIRPLARRAVSISNALAFTAFQMIFVGVCLAMIS